MKSFNTLILTGSVTAALAITSLTGCASWSERKARESGRTVAEVAQDSRITDAVDSALKTAAVYKFPQIAVQTYRGDVQLSGFVATDAQKKAATDIAQQVTGVNRVINQISVMPESPTPTGRNLNVNEPNHAPIINGTGQHQNQNQPNETFSNPNQNQPNQNPSNQPPANPNQPNQPTPTR